jgi:hypothetical protein
MNGRRVLFFAVLADAILTIASFAVDSYQREGCYGYYIDWIPDSLWLAVLVGFPALLAIGWVGLLRFWSPARYCYLGAWGITILQYAIHGDTTRPGWVYGLYSIVGITGGFLIALIFFSDLRKLFESEPVDRRMHTDEGRVS